MTLVGRFGGLDPRSRVAADTVVRRGLQSGEQGVAYGVSAAKPAATIQVHGEAARLRT